MKKQKTVSKKSTNKTQPLVGEKNSLPELQNPSKFSLKYKLAVLCAVIGFLLYANTLHNDYTVDDGTVIKNNKITTKGIKAIPEIFETAYRKGFWDRKESLYRPLSLVMFAAEYQLSPDNPHVGHWVNVILYALTAFILFIMLSSLINKNNLIIPLIVSLLFIAHPIHTEVVANIKSRDEILSLLFTVISFYFLSRYLNKQTIINLFLAGVSFFLALLSKESAITCVVIAPMIVWFFNKDVSIKKLIAPTVPYCIAAILYLLIRFMVLHGITNFTEILPINNSLVNAPDFLTRFATSVMILGKYLLLLFIPHPLVFDYSYNQIPNVGLSNVYALISLAVYCGMIIYALRTFKTKSIMSFGILFFLITISLVSNVVFLIESVMAERFLYLPSLGFCIAITILLVNIFKTDTIKSFTLSGMINGNKTLFAFITIIFLFFSFKTISRNVDWKDNLTLLAHDVKTSSESARIRYAYGSAILIEEALKEKDKERKNALLDKAIEQLERGVAILNTYADAYFHLGLAYKERGNYVNAIKNFESARKLKTFNEVDFLIASGLSYAALKQYDKAIADFKQAVIVDPKSIDAYNNLGVYYDEWGKVNESIESLNHAIAIDPKAGKSYYNMGNTYAHCGKYNEAIEYYKKAVAINSKDEDALNNIGNCYATMKEYNNAIEYYKKVIEIDPQNSKVLYNIGITYKILGNIPEGDKFIQQSQAVQAGK